MILLHVKVAWVVTLWVVSIQGGATTRCRLVNQICLDDTPVLGHTFAEVALVYLLAHNGFIQLLHLRERKKLGQEAKSHRRAVKPAFYKPQRTLYHLAMVET